MLIPEGLRWRGTRGEESLPLGSPGNSVALAISRGSSLLLGFDYGLRKEGGEAAPKDQLLCNEGSLMEACCGTFCSCAGAAWPFWNIEGMCWTFSALSLSEASGMTSVWTVRH